MAPTSLPTCKSLLTSLFSTLPPNPTIPSDDNSSLFSATKPILLTIHGLFPTLLLPALHLLDRRLITCFTLHDESTDRSTHAEGACGNDRGRDQSSRVVYYVKSIAQRDSRSRYSRSGDAGGTSYEVRTGAWNCSCAAFAFAAFNGETDSPAHEPFEGFEDRGMAEEDEEMLDGPEIGKGDERRGDWQWGGLMLGSEQVPLCKHLLACVLVERWDVGGNLVEEKIVGREEMAGWAAGWGG